MKKSVLFLLGLCSLFFISCKSEKIEFKNYERYDFKNRIIIEETSFTFDMDEMKVLVSEIQHSFPTDMKESANDEIFSEEKILREGNPLENGYVSVMNSSGVENSILIENGSLSYEDVICELIKNGKQHKKISKLFNKYYSLLEEMNLEKIKEVADELKAFEKTEEWTIKDDFEFFQMNDLISRMENK